MVRIETYFTTNGLWHRELSFFSISHDLFRLSSPINGLTHSLHLISIRYSFTVRESRFQSMLSLIISFFFHARNEIKSFVKLRDCRAQNVNRQCDQNPVKLLSDLSFVPEAYFTHTHTTVAKGYRHGYFYMHIMSMDIQLIGNGC